MAAQPEPPEVQPHNVETEAALLGALMIDNRLVDSIADKRLLAEHFFEPMHGRIYSAILNEAMQGRTANPITLRPYFADDEAMKTVGGPAYLAQLTGSGAAVIGAHDFAFQVVELARRRQLRGALEDIIDGANDPYNTYDEMVASAEAAINEISQDTADGTVEVSAAKAVVAAIEPTDTGRGVLTGIEALDRALGPIKRRQLVILAGRPGMGKSVVASSVSLGVTRAHEDLDADHVRHGVLFITLEMGADELGGRMAADLSFNGHSGINYADIEANRLTVEQGRMLARVANRIEHLPLQIVDVGSMTLGRLNATVRRWKRRFAARGVTLELVIVDYLQLLRPDHKCRDRYEAVTEVSIGLKSLAKTHDVGVLALAQLSREVEKREDKRPRLSDLRDSGSIEQDADGVCFVYRRDYYLSKEEPDEDDPKRAEWATAMEAVSGQIEYIVAKRRGRPEGIGRGRWYGAFQAVR